MKDFKYIWLLGLVGTILIVAAPVLAFIRPEPSPSSDPWDYVPQRVPTTDHSVLMEGPFETGSDVTRACLECHEEAGQEMLQTAHWNWEGEPVLLPGRDEPVTIGKKNSINNFCIGIQSNWSGCTSCHAGYGWEDADFDFTNAENVDCLVCHDTSGTYAKTTAGYPAEGVDLVAAAQSVGIPSRQNCGSCHFNGGGGNGVKHGDMDESLYFPSETVDVHMGRHDFACVDCHQTTDHDIAGRSISVSVDTDNQVACTDCHAPDLHEDERIDMHMDHVACQTCHIPAGAVRDPTKMHWDWSTAGQDLPVDDPHVYLKIKGSFVYERNFMPEYAWHNGETDRYILGDTINPLVPTVINQPLGNIQDEASKIWPFKIHSANQIYDAVNNYLIQPQTVGEDGYWTHFDWDRAARNGMAAVGLPYSGEYDFAPTEMYWNLSHMVAPTEYALQCTDCHGAEGRLDWQALGYYGDPLTWGGRAQQALLGSEE